MLGDKKFDFQTIICTASCENLQACCSSSPINFCSQFTAQWCSFSAQIAWLAYHWLICWCLKVITLPVYFTEFLIGNAPVTLSLTRFSSPWIRFRPPLTPFLLSGTSVRIRVHGWRFFCLITFVRYSWFCLPSSSNFSYFFLKISTCPLLILFSARSLSLTPSVCSEKLYILHDIFHLFRLFSQSLSKLPWVLCLCSAVTDPAFEVYPRGFPPPGSTPSLCLRGLPFCSVRAQDLLWFHSARFQEIGCFLFPE